MFVIDTLAAVFTPFYYEHFKSFHGLFYFALVFSTLILIGTIFFIPESFRYYITTRRYTKAKEVLLQISRINKTNLTLLNIVTPDDFKFEQEVEKQDASDKTT